MSTSATIRRRNSRLISEALLNERNKETAKIRAINEALVHHDIEQLRVLGRQSLGFVDDGLRRRVWLSLLRVDTAKLTKFIPSGFLPSPIVFVDADHPDSQQVEVDVARSFVHFPADVRVSFKKQKQVELSNVINAVLSRNRFLQYYQGFHDVCSVLVLVLGERAAFLAAERISLLFLRDAMAPSLEHVMKQLSLVPTLIHADDYELFEFLKKVNLMPYFALSWVLTWFSHNVKHLELATRLFDFFLCSNPLMPVYFSATLLMFRRESIFTLEVDDEAEYQAFIQKLPTPLFMINPLRYIQYTDLQILDDLIEHTWILWEKYPPHKLMKLPYSVKLHDHSCVFRFNDEFKMMDVSFDEFHMEKDHDVLEYQTKLIVRDILEKPLSKPKQEIRIQMQSVRYTLLTLAASVTSLALWYLANDWQRALS